MRDRERVQTGNKEQSDLFQALGHFLLLHFAFPGVGEKYYTQHLPNKLYEYFSKFEEKWSKTQGKDKFFPLLFLQLPPPPPPRVKIFVQNRIRGCAIFFLPEKLITKEVHLLLLQLAYNCILISRVGHRVLFRSVCSVLFRSLKGTFRSFPFFF